MIFFTAPYDEVECGRVWNPPLQAIMRLCTQQAVAPHDRDRGGYEMRYQRGRGTLKHQPCTEESSGATRKRREVTGMRAGAG